VRQELVLSEAEGTDAAGAVTAVREWSPYGEEVGGAQAGLGYTGEWYDTSVGLQYLRARWLDVGTRRFTQMDLLVPSDPYVYATANPIKYVDPSGYIKENPPTEAVMADAIRKQLAVEYGVLIRRDYGYLNPTNDSQIIPPHFEVDKHNNIIMICETTYTNALWEEGYWELSELVLLSEAISDLTFWMGGTAKFRRNLGGVTVHRGEMNLGSAHNIFLYTYKISYSQTSAIGFDKWTVVHELAHAWDGNKLGLLSWNLMNFVGASYVLPQQLPSGDKYIYDPGVWPPPAGINIQFNHLEDFAESLTAFVYPQEAKDRASTRGISYGNYGYTNYYQTERAKYIAKILNREHERQILAILLR
jgi:RHS repeat-associated protein